MSIMKTVSLPPLVLWLMLLGCSGSPKTAVAPSSGTAQDQEQPSIRKLSLSGYTVQVYAEVADKRKFKDLWGWWGATGEKPRIVTNVTIYLNDDRLLVPRSSFADLAGVDQVSLKPVANGVLIEITGGSAPESYRATIRIMGSEVVERWVKSAVFPESWWEHTVYSDKSIDN